MWTGNFEKLKGKQKKDILPSTPTPIFRIFWTHGKRNVISLLLVRFDLLTSCLEGDKEYECILVHVNFYPMAKSNFYPITFIVGFTLFQHSKTFSSTVSKIHCDPFKSIYTFSLCPSSWKLPIYIFFSWTEITSENTFPKIGTLNAIFIDHSSRRMQIIQEFLALIWRVGLKN